ncbi:MAG: tetratricopeptide repeat protein [Bacteroidaceae bacterium]|nr:tetratricopeptide repeat protein [Bacteroidaceae bacterium]
MIRTHAAKWLVAVLVLSPTVSYSQINTDRMMTVGQNALYFEDYVLSIQYFNQIIRAKPYLYEPYYYRAIAKLSLEDWRGAEQDCNSSIERNPFVVNSYQVRGLARVYQHDYSNASSDFRMGLSLDPQNCQLRHNLILSLARDGHIDEALADADTLLSAWPRYADGYAIKSELLWEKGDSLGAFDCMNKAVDLDRFNPDLLVYRAILKARMELYDQALPDLDRAIYLEPTHTSAYMNRAMVHYERDSLNAAMADYDMVLRIEPKNVTGHYNRGNLRAQVGDDNRAIEDFDFVIDAEPDNMFAFFNRGVLRYNTGDYPGAEADISRVLEEYPEFVTGYQLRSEVREKLGLFSLAQEDAMVVLREHNRRYNRAHGFDDDTDAGQPDSKTRSSKDRNVAGYRKIIVDDDLENSTGFSSAYRGRVQNRNVEVRFLSPLRLTYFNSDDILSRRPITSALLEGISGGNGTMPGLRFEDSGCQLDRSQIAELFADVNRLSAKLSTDPENVIDLLLRAIDFCLLQDFQSALADVESARSIHDDGWLLWFVKAQITAKMHELDEDTNMFPLIEFMNNVLDIEPEMAPAYYNRGTFYAMSEDYNAALADFNRAIELEPEMAQAWYNRGVVLVLLNRTDQAIDDFGKAGELGLPGAYNIIKRFSQPE